MRRAAWGLPVSLLAGGIVGASLTAERAPARAQSPAPVEIHRVQDASHAPPRNKEGPIFILALGSDARPGEEVNRSRADSIHIIGLNAQEGGAGIIGFPRDSFVSVPGAGERRINEALFYGGPELQVRTVEELTAIKIDYYMITSFQGFRKIVKGIRGIPIEVKYPMSDDASGTHFKPGNRELGPADALAFARDRHSAPGGDFGRSENQGRLLAAALRHLHDEMAADPAVLLSWIRVGMRNVGTNLSLIEVFDLAIAATSVDPQKVENRVVPGGTGDVGGASVVFIGGGAESMYDDLRDDGLLND